MSINRIGRLRNCRVFRDFTWPADLHAFARFNLIYGWNGSGENDYKSHIQGFRTSSPTDNW